MDFRLTVVLFGERVRVYDVEASAGHQEATGNVVLPFTLYSRGSVSRRSRRES